ncbi:uncharacterized protein [Asterias amurensis]|uniref:uncharacterized protein n=1 Tax=Asterias amurensis TaxID=7602 RepID=UPI003AB20F74
MAARILTGTRRNDHITPVLRSLHWLPVTRRIQYKLILIIYKACHNLAPRYLTDLLIPYTPARSLRSSSDTSLLRVPAVNLKSAGERAFCRVAPQLWNSLPADLKNVNSIAVFKCRLKT